MRAVFLKAFKGQLSVEALIRFRSLIILPIATRALGPEGYGWIAYAAAITGLVGTVATLGMPQAMTRFLPGKETDDERARIFWPAFVSASTTIVAFAVLTPIVFAITPLAPSGLPFVLIIVAALNVISNEVKLALYSFWRINIEYDQYYRFLVADALLGLGAQLVVLLALDGGPIALICSTIVVDTILMALALFVLWRRLEWHPPSADVIRPLYRFGLPLGVTAVLVWANNMADRFFVQFYDGSGAVGVYSVGYNLGVLAVAIIGTPMVNVVSSTMFRLWDRGEREEAERVPRRCATILVLACLPAILSLGYFGQPFVDLVAGSEFSAAHDYVVLVAVGYLLLHIGVLFGYPLWLHNRQYLYSLSMALSVGLNIVGNAVLVPRHGAMGSAIATTASLGLLTAALVVWNLRAGYARPQIALPAAITATAIVCWAIADLAWPSSPTIFDTILFSVLTTLAFAAIAYALRLVPSELNPSLLWRRIAAP